MHPKTIFDVIQTAAVVVNQLNKGTASPSKAELQATQAELLQARQDAAAAEQSRIDGLLRQIRSACDKTTGSPPHIASDAAKFRSMLIVDPNNREVRNTYLAMRGPNELEMDRREGLASGYHRTVPGAVALTILGAAMGHLFGRGGGGTAGFLVGGMVGVGLVLFFPSWTSRLWVRVGPNPPKSMERF